MNDNIENVVVGIVRKYREFIRSKSDLHHINKILIIRVDHLGDMICTVPFIRELRGNCPTAEITLVCSPETYNYLEFIPYVDKIICYKKLITGKHLFERSLLSVYRFVNEYLHNIHFDLIFCPRCPTSSVERIMAYLASGKRVFCFERKDRYIGISDTDFIKDIYIAKHEIESTLDLLTAINYKCTSDHLEIWYTDNDIRLVEELFLQAKVETSRLKVVVFLSTSAAYKDWSVDNYAIVCKKLQDEYDAQIILLGAKCDTEEKGEKFCQLVSGVYNFIGRTTVRQTEVVIRKSDLYLGGDTGTLHLAAACKIPGVVVTKDYEGATHELGAPMERYYPWKAPIRIVRPDAPLTGCEKWCAKTFAHCINQIHPDTVWNELLNVIETHDLLCGKLK